MKSQIVALLFTFAVLASANAESSFEQLKVVVSGAVKDIASVNEQYDRNTTSIDDGATKIKGQIPEFELKQFTNDLHYLKDIVLYKMDSILYYVKYVFASPDFGDDLKHEEKMFELRVGRASNELITKVLKELFEGNDKSNAHVCFQKFMDALNNVTDEVKTTVYDKSAEQYVKIVSVTTDAYKGVEAGVKLAKSFDSTFQECKGSEKVEECVRTKVTAFKTASSEYLMSANLTKKDAEEVMQNTALFVEATNKKILETFTAQLADVEKVAVECMKN